MIHIKDIPKKILIAVRWRLGAESDDDTRFDSKIETMSPKYLLMEWSAWEIGDGYWANFIIENYELLKEKQGCELDCDGIGKN